MEDMAKKFEDKRVLITGCTGYIGSRLVYEILSRGYHVRGLVQDKDVETECVSDLKKRGMEVWIGDLTQSDSIKGIGKDANILVHLAGLHSTVDKMTDLYVNGTRNLLNEIDEKKIEKIIFSSSGAVYGDRGSEILTEEVTLEPKHPFGIISNNAEEIISNYGKKRANVDTIIFRIGEVYGPGIYNPFNRISFQGLSAFGDGTDYSSYIEIEDVINIFMLAMNNKIEGIFNLVDDMPVPRREFYQSISDLSGGIPIKWVNMDTLPERIRLSIHGLRMLSIRMSNNKIKDVLNYHFNTANCFVGMERIIKCKG